MVRCEMCGMQVPAGPNGKCFLGHVLPAGVVAAGPTIAAPPVPMPSPPGSPPTFSVPAEPQPEPVASPPVAHVAPEPFAPSVSPDLIAAVVAEVESAPPSSSDIQSPPTAPLSAPRPLGDPPAGALTPPRPLGQSSGAPLTPPRPLGSAPVPPMPAPGVVQPVPPAPLNSPPVPAPLNPPPVPSPFNAPAPLHNPPAPAPPGNDVFAPTPLASVPPSPAGAPAEMPGPAAAPASVESFVPPSVRGATVGNAALAVEAAMPQPVAHADMFVVSRNESVKRGPNRILLLVLVVALLGGAGFAAKTFLLTGDSVGTGGAAGDAPVTVREAGSLTRAFVAEQSHRYRMTATIATTMRKGTESESFDADVEMLFTETIASQAADGSATLRYTFDSAVMRVSGEEVDVPFRPGTGMEVTLDAKGKVADVKQIGGGELPVDSSFYDMLAPVLPPGAKPGSRWSRVDTPSLPNVGEMKIKTAFHYVKDEGPTAVVDSRSEAPLAMTMGADQLEGMAGASGGAFEIRGRLLSNGRQIVEKATGRTLSADADMAITFAFLQDGQELGRMAMKVKFAIGPAGASTNAA